MPERAPEEAVRFRTVFRGFDPDEVYRFIASVRDELEAVIAERDRLANRLAEIGDRDLQAEFQAIGREVGQVLEAARQAAEAMRERAVADAARWRSEAIAEAETVRRQARADAEQLRGDAWTTAEELLNQAQREARRIVDEAEQEALRRMGEAERESHRLVVNARREAEDLVRNARMEAERLLMEANSRRDEIVETARRQAESAQERTRALEQRRDELKKELDSVREALAALEGELDERRERLGLSVESQERPPPSRWEPGETVRVVRPREERSRDGAPSHTRLETEEVSVDELGPEIKVISAEEVRRRQAGTRPTGPDETGETDTTVAEESTVEEPLVEEPVGGEPTTEESTSEQPEEPPGEELRRGRVEAASTGGKPQPAAESSFDDLAGLFAKLREPAQPQGRPEERPEREATLEKLVEAGPAAESSDPYELRDRLLLAVTNRALRSLKRQLTEEQNVVLEEIRLRELDWTPAEDSIRERVNAELLVLVAEASAAGHAAAEELTRRRLKRPPAVKNQDFGGFADDLTEELRHVLEEAKATGQGARQLSAAVSRVFRAWRTDEAERRVRDLAFAAYHRGLAGSVGSVRWLVAGRGCATCRAAAEGDPTVEFPPAHPECSCTVAPA